MRVKLVNSIFRRVLYGYAWYLFFQVLRELANFIDRITRGAGASVANAVLFLNRTHPFAFYLPVLSLAEEHFNFLAVHELQIFSDSVLNSFSTASVLPHCLQTKLIRP